MAASAFFTQPVIAPEPEIHIIGEIVGGSGFDSDNAFCHFNIKTGITTSIEAWIFVFQGQNLRV